MKPPLFYGLTPGGRAFILSEILLRRRQFVVLIILSIIAAIFEMMGVGLVFPLIMIIVSPSSIDKFAPLVWLVDVLGVGRGRGLLVLLTCLIGIVMISKNLYMIGFNWLQQNILANWKSELSARLMGLYIYSEYRLYLEKPSSEFIRNISLTTAVFDQFISGMINTIVNSIILLAVTSLVIFVLPPETFVGLIAIFLTVGACYFAMKRPFEKIGVELNILFQKRQSILRQSIGLIKETRIMAKETFFLNRFVDVERQNFNRSAYYNFLSCIPPLIIEAMVILAILSLVGYILLKSGSEATGLATLGLLAAALFRSVPLLNRTLTALQLINLSRNTVEIVGKEIFELEASVRVPTGEVLKLPFNHLVKLDNISYRYPTGNRLALINASLGINKGEYLGITGPSGAGKSTLAAILLGLISPTSGRVLIDGIDIDNAVHKRGWQKNIGFVPQDVMLVEDTIANNIAFGLDGDIDKGKIWQILDMVQMKLFVEELPDQLNYFLGEDGIRLSGGQRQRLGIARALYYDPEFLLLDEATSALDVATEQAFTGMLNSMRGTLTIIIMSHRLSTLRDCNRVAMISNGSVVDVAPFDELQERCPEFQKLVELSNIKHQI